MAIDISGTWYNQHGSRIDLEVDGEGRIRGRFRSGVGSPDPDEEFEVTGVVTDGLVAFTVSFAKYDSVTSWTGHCGMEDDHETIYALWHMSVGLPPARHADQLWEGIWSGADTFLREEAPHARRPRTRSHPTAAGRGYPP